MNPIWQIANIVIGGLVLAVMVGLAKLVANKADKTEVAKLNEEHKADDVKEHNNVKEAIGKLEVKLDAALLIVATSITRPELAEKILAITGRSDDRMARVLADIVQLTTDMKSNTKAIDNLPERVTALEQQARVK